MSYSYQAPLTYGPQKYPLTYDSPQVTMAQDNNVPQEYVQQDVQPEPKNDIKSSIPAGLAGAGLGAVTGGIAGGINSAKKNPCVIDGNNINDKFATKVYERYRKKVPDTGVSMKQIDEMISKINSSKSADELRALFAANPEAAEEACSALGKTPDQFLNNVNKLNLRRNKRSILNKLKESKNTKIDDIKNDIFTYWNSAKKRFEKGTNPDKDLYGAIKRTSAEMHAGAIAKAAGIGAVIAAVVLFAAHKILHLKKGIQKNQH